MTDEEQTDVDADTVARLPPSAPVALDTPDTSVVREALPQVPDQTDLASASTLGLGAPQGVDSFLRERVFSSLFSSFERSQRKLDRFHILDRLGAGGMGVVYSGYDEDLDRRIAIKLVRSPDADRADIYAKRLLREARVMAKLGHPNVVQVYQVGLSEEGTFIAMEFIEGQTLADWLTSSEQRSWREVVDIFVQAGRGLAAAHAAGIVHRDFKPANAMIDRQGVVKVLDFGLARDGSPAETVDAGRQLDAVGSKARERLTQTGAMMGTPAYMSPEQFHGLPATAKSDQYNFAVALYQGLYGELPFPMDTMKQLLEAMSSGAVLPPPSKHEVPDWVRQLVLRGLSAKPEHRHESMEVLLDALERDPVARRRRVMGLGAAAFCIGLMGFVSSSALTEPAPTQAAPSCAGVGEEITRVWSPQRSEAIGEALVNTKASHAAETWERVAPQIDDYAARWADMRQEACEAHLSGQQTSASFDLRTQCLDRSLTTMKGVLSLLEVAEPQTVDELPLIIGELPRLERCDDLSALHSEGVEPPGPQIAAKVQQLRSEIADARAYLIVGQYDAGLERIQAIVAQAEELGYRPLEAEALLQQGYLQQDSSKATDEQTLASLKRAKLVGIEASHRRVIAEAKSRYMVVLGYREQLDAALEEADEVEAYLMGLPDAQHLRGIYLNDRAGILRRKGNFAESVGFFKKSLEIKRAVFGERHHHVGFTLSNLALSYAEQGALHSAVESLAESQAIHLEGFGPHHPETALAMVWHAEALLELDRRMEARQLLECARETLTADFEPAYKMALLSLAERDHAAARVWAEGALELATDGELMVAALLSRQALAKVELAEGEVERALELQAAVVEEIRTEIGETRLYASSLQQLALLEHEAGEHDRAIERNLELLALLERLELGASMEAYRTYLSLGRAQAGAGQMREALSSFQDAITLREKRGIADDAFVRARLEFERSKVLLALGRAEDAQVSLGFAVETFEDDCDEDSLELALARFGLAQALMRLEPAQVERAKQLSGLASRVLAQRGAAFAEEAEQVDTWRRAQGWWS